MTTSATVSTLILSCDKSRFFQGLFRRVAQNWAVPAYHPFGDIDAWLQASGLQCVSRHDLSWRLAPSAIQSIPLSIWCGLGLLCQREYKTWRWRQLAASAQSLLLGLQRRNFRYYMLVLEKP